MPTEQTLGFVVSPQREPGDESADDHQPLRPTNSPSHARCTPADNTPSKPSPTSSESAEQPSTDTSTQPRRHPRHRRSQPERRPDPSERYFAGRDSFGSTGPSSDVSRSASSSRRYRRDALLGLTQAPTAERVHKILAGGAWRRRHTPRSQY